MGEGSGWDLRVRPSAAAAAEAAAASGNLGIWRSGGLEIQKFGFQKIKKIKILKIQIRSAQNVGKVWISRKKASRVPFGAIPGHFSMDRKTKNKNAHFFLPIFLGGPISPIHPVWAVLLSTRGGEIGTNQS